MATVAFQNIATQNDEIQNQLSRKLTNTKKYQLQKVLRILSSLQKCLRNSVCWKLEILRKFNRKMSFSIFERLKFIFLGKVIRRFLRIS